MKHSLFAWITVCGVLAVLTVPVAAQEAKARPKPEEMFDKLDKNGDGKLTRDELPDQARERLERLFKKLGKDSLTKEDFAKIAGRRPGGSGRQGAGRGELAGKRAEEFFKRLDANGDGKITKDEVSDQFKPRMEALLRQAGKGQDGSISKEEFTKLMSRRRGPGGQPGQGPRGPQPGSGRPRLPLFFQMLDTDKDGKLSKDEVAKAAEKFDELDKNKDGKLDPRELLGPGGQGGPQFRRPGGGDRPGGPPQRRPGSGGGEGAERFFKQLDKNGDGKISKDEAPERLKQNFSKFDANNDGSIDRDELKKRFAGHRGGRPGEKRPEGRRKREN